MDCEGSGGIRDRAAQVRRLEERAERRVETGDEPVPVDEVLVSAGEGCAPPAVPGKSAEIVWPAT